MLPTLSRKMAPGGILLELREMRTKISSLRNCHDEGAKSFSKTGKSKGIYWLPSTGFIAGGILLSVLRGKARSEG